MDDTQSAKKPAGNAKNQKGVAKEGLIVAAAKAIGSVAGSVAHSIGVHGEPPAPPRPSGKLPPKHKSRLPRRLKKTMRKQSAAQQAA